MPVRNPTQWQAPSGTGYFSPGGGLGLTTLSNSQLVTLAGVSLVTDTDIYTPKSQTAWDIATKSDTQWTPLSGKGFVIIGGTLYMTDNSGDYIVTNNGDYLVTTPTYDIPKYATAWSATGV